MSSENGSAMEVSGPECTRESLVVSYHSKWTPGYALSEYECLREEVGVLQVFYVELEFIQEYAFQQLRTLGHTIYYQQPVCDAGR